MSDKNGGIKTTSVKYTGSGKPFGADIFIGVEAVYEFNTLASDEEAAQVQEDLAVQLQAQVLELVKQAVANTKSAIASQPRGQVSVHPATPQVTEGTQSGTVAPSGTAPNAVRAVANGAQQSQGDWRSVNSRFGDGQIRFISSQAYPSDALKADVYKWIEGQGIDPNIFDIWDERTGPRGAEAGNPIGSVFNIKVKKDFQDLVTEEFHKNAAGRGKFNNDGSIYPYWSKDFEAFLKYNKAKVTLAGF